MVFYIFVLLVFKLFCFFHRTIPTEDENAIAQMLERVLPQIRAGRYPIPAREAVMSVSRRAGAQQLAELLDLSVLKTR